MENMLRERDAEDRRWMREAILEAEKAASIGEVPIGAVIVRDGVIVGRGHNLRETGKDPTAHAEILALRQASSTLGGWRLPRAVMYVTLEPCPMCAGALVQARVERLVFGARDPKAGCAGTLLNLVQFPSFNHQLQVTEGVLSDECSELLRRFFRQLRQKS
jgi:tRNA(adenine34) deaminase